MITAAGARIGWADLPGSVQAGIEEVLGSRVVQARAQSGRFSPGMPTECSWRTVSGPSSKRSRRHRTR